MPISEDFGYDDTVLQISGGVEPSTVCSITVPMIRHLAMLDASVIAPMDVQPGDQDAIAAPWLIPPSIRPVSRQRSFGLIYRGRPRITAKGTLNIFPSPNIFATHSAGISCL